MRRFTETVVVNIYGDTAEQIVNDPNWEADYAAYLAKWEADHPKQEPRSIAVPSWTPEPNFKKEYDRE